MTFAAISESAALRAFRHRNYRLFFAGQAVSLVGSWMQAVAQGWLVLTLTHDPFTLGVVAAAQWTPVLLLGLFGGIIADALPKRQTLVVLEGAFAVLALVLGVLTLTHAVTVPIVLVLAVLFGIVNAVEMPVRQSFAVEMVGREDVVNAVALNSALFNGARVVGPAIAGLTIAAVDIGWAFVLNGASFLAVIAGLLLMRDADLHAPPPMRRPHTVREVFASIAEGASYVRRVPVVLMATALVGVAATLGFNFQVTIPPFVLGTVGNNPTALGWLMTATGVGSIVAALALATRRQPNAWWIPIGAVLLGLGQLAAALVPAYAFALFVLCLAGFGGVLMAASANTAIQATVPDELRGRVMSVYTTVFAGSTPIGALLSGWLAATFGPVVAIGVAGALAALVGGVGLLWLRYDRTTTHVGGRAHATGVPAGSKARAVR